jgi:hypothetical protein
MMEHSNEAPSKGLTHSPTMTKVDILPPPIPAQDEGREGLMSAKALTVLGLWYFFSFWTLILNKHILVVMKAEAVFFG